MQYKHPFLDDSVNVTKTNPLIEFFSYTFGICVLVALVYYLSVFAVELIVPHVSVKTERKMWDLFLKESLIAQEGKRTVQVRAAEKYLQRLLDRIPKNADTHYDYQVIVVDKPVINAVALPSGKIVVYTGLLDKLRSENAVVFVLGHELGHFAHRDQLRGMGRKLVAAALLTPLMSGDADLSSLFTTVNTGFQMDFSREQELAADLFGLNAVMRVYGHVGGAMEFLNYARDHMKSHSAFQYESTHPLSEDRINQLKAVIERQHLKLLPTIPKAQ